MSAQWRAALIVAGLVSVACLSGMLTRPTGFLAALWPANAVFLTLLVRLPGAARPPGIMAAGAAYALVDLAIGSSPLHTAFLNIGNMVSVLSTYIVWSMFPKATSRLGAPTVALVIIVSSAVGSAVAGGIGAMADPILFGKGWDEGWAYWFATEFLNYMIFLPTFLSVPTSFGKGEWESVKRAGRSFGNILPIVAIVVSASIALVIGGPGALAFSVPALLWVALTYSVFATAALAMVFNLWLMFSISDNSILNIDPTDQASQTSLRLGISLIALFPVVLSHVMRHREEMLSQLRHVATHDSLTGALNVASFIDIARERMNGTSFEFAVLMLDIDHFKRINDTHGHHAGDHALRYFAQAVRKCLRSDDLFGRVGGEEFSTMMACKEAVASEIATRIRETVNEPFLLENGHTLRMTVSIGLVTGYSGPTRPIGELLKQADKLLYQAKRNGRDRTETVLDPAVAYD